MSEATASPRSLDSADKPSTRSRYYVLGLLTVVLQF